MGETLTLVDKPFVAKAHAAITDYDLLSVKITSAYAGKSNLAVNLNSPIHHIGRLEVDSCKGDGVHLGGACKDLVVEEGVIYVHDLPPTAQHWDAFQALAGARCTFRNLTVVQRNPGYDTEGRCVFMRAGSAPEDLADVVFEHCYFESHRDPISTKTQVVTISESLRCGLRECTIAEAQAGHSPLWLKADAVQPVNERNIIIPADQPVPLHP
jgi:hypothetical protein